MKTNSLFKKLRLFLIIGISVYSINGMAQNNDMAVNNSYPRLKDLIDIPGKYDGYKYIVTKDEFKKFSELKSKISDTICKVKSYRVMEIGRDSGLVIINCKGASIEEGIRNSLDKMPFLDRVIFFDIKYDSSDENKGKEWTDILTKDVDRLKLASDKGLYLTRTFILDIK